MPRTHEVLFYLVHEQPATSTELREKYFAHEEGRNVGGSLRRLHDAGLVNRRPRIAAIPKTGRTPYEYTLADPDEVPDPAGGDD